VVRKPANVLVVDDDSVHRTLLSRRLEKEGYITTAVPSGEAAVDVLEDGPTELVLLDVMMPGIGGFEVLDRLRTRYSPVQLPVIMVTALDDSRTVVEALDHGVNDYITKPIEFPVALARIRAVLTQKYACDAMLEARREKELSELGSPMLSMVSHQLRTPLTVILSSAELLNMQAELVDSEKAGLHYRRIRRAVKHMACMVDEVLQLSKLQHATMPLQRQSVALVEFAAERVAEAQKSASDRNPISVSVMGQVRRVLVDPKILTAVLHNLLENASKYSSEGSLVEVEVDFTEHDVVLRVRDEGIGIPEEDLGRVFDAFHRAKNVLGLPGTGLGLCTVREFVKLEGGRVSINSREGHGTVVTVVLPDHQ